MRLATCLGTTASVVFVALAGPGAHGADAPAGSWQCQSANGPATLEFHDGATLSYGGQPMPYRIFGSAIVVMQGGEAIAFPYTLRGSQLDIATPTGDAIRCARAEASRPSASSPSPSASPRGAYNHLLQGRLCAWSGSSSSGTSYSSTQKVFFDGRGRFTTGAESSFNVTSRDGSGNEVGSAAGYGGSDGPGGTYEITQAQPGAPIRVKWDSGEDDIAYVHHVSGGRITEVKYGKLLFAAGLCE